MIKNFNHSDIKEAAKIVHLVWGNFYAQESPEVQNIIYDFTLKYYDLNHKFSFSIFDNEFKGFLFASLKSDSNNSVIEFKKQIFKLANPKSQKTILDLYNYLDTCGKMVHEIMNKDDLMIGLFVSIQKGCGRQLLNELTKTARNNKIKNIYLWTDTTCNYEYYSKNNFELVKKIKNYINEKPITTLIYKKAV